MRTVVINNVDQEWYSLYVEGKDITYQNLVNHLIEDLDTSIKKVYFCTKEFIKDSQGNVLKSLWKITFVYLQGGFAYYLKQLAVNKQIKRKDIIISSSIWEEYLTTLNLKVFRLSYLWGKRYFKELTIEESLKRIVWATLNPKYLNDYLFLQEVNPDSIWLKKTVSLLMKYNGIENLIENYHEIDDLKLRSLIEYQLEKIKYFIFLKNFLLTKADLLPWLSQT